MKKEDYQRMDDKLDKQTDMLLDIINLHHKETSLMKLAHQKLKYMTVTLAFIVMVRLYVDYPKLAIFIAKIL